MRVKQGASNSGQTQNNNWVNEGGKTEKKPSDNVSKLNQTMQGNDGEERSSALSML